MVMTMITVRLNGVQGRSKKMLFILILADNKNRVWDGFVNITDHSIFLRRYFGNYDGIFYGNNRLESSGELLWSTFGLVTF